MKRTLRWLHLWVGLALALPLVMLGLTGTILVFDRQIDALLSPAAHRASGGPSRPASAILEAARLAAPDGQVPTFYQPPDTPGEPAIVRFQQPGQRGPGFGAQIFVDPATLDILDRRDGPDGFVRQVHRLHGNLLLPGRDGRSVIGWLGVVMLAMGLTGLVLWWPRPGRWRAAFRVARDARGARLHRELHGAAGVWGVAVLVIVSFSGVDLAFPETVASAVGLILPGAEIRPAPAPRAERAQGREAVDLDGAIGLATTAVPATILRSVGLPGGPDQPYRIGLARAGSDEGAPVITVFVDPYAARVAEIRDPATYPAGLRLIAWQRALQAGEGLGPVWRILVALCGLLPLLFAVTGISMWVLKRRGRRRRVAMRETSLVGAE